MIFSGKPFKLEQGFLKQPLKTILDIRQELYIMLKFKTTETSSVGE